MSAKSSLPRRRGRKQAAPWHGRASSAPAPLLLELHHQRRGARLGDNLAAAPHRDLVHADVPDCVDRDDRLQLAAAYELSLELLPIQKDPVEWPEALAAYFQSRRPGALGDGGRRYVDRLRQLLPRIELRNRIDVAGELVMDDLAIHDDHLDVLRHPDVLERIAVDDR